MTITTPATTTSPTDLEHHLQAVLVELVTLGVTLKQAHWTVRGPGFRSLHLALDDVVTESREHADTIAERMRALGFVPDGRLSTAATTSTLPTFPLGEVDVATTTSLVTATLARVVEVLREVHDDVDDADPTSADLLHVLIEGLEKDVWLISSETA